MQVMQSKSINPNETNDEKFETEGTFHEFIAQIHVKSQHIST